MHLNVQLSLPNLNFRLCKIERDRNVSWQWMLLWSAGISGTNKHRKKPPFGTVLIILKDYMYIVDFL